MSNLSSLPDWFDGGGDYSDGRSNVKKGGMESLLTVPSTARLQLPLEHDDMRIAVLWRLLRVPAQLIGRELGHRWTHGALLLFRMGFAIQAGGVWNRGLGIRHPPSRLLLQPLGQPSFAALNARLLCRAGIELFGPSRDCRFRSPPVGCVCLSRRPLRRRSLRWSLRTSVALLRKGECRQERDSCRHCKLP